VRTTLLVHVTAGGLGIVAGFLALYSAKGAWLHRRSGIVFFCAMVVMALSGAVIAALRGAEASVIGGMLACYLVVTALATVRPHGAQSARLDVGLLLVALAIAMASLVLGFDAVGRGGVREGIPAVVLFKFALVALLAGAGDLRVIRSGALRGAPRLARHLWRMCFALYIATASFFFGQADKLPEALRVPVLLAFPVVAVVVTMFYWLWRVRIRRSLRGVAGIGVAETA
jgi:hypothetical protein